MTVNFSLRLLETSTDGRQAERLEAPVVTALLAEVDQHLALALQQLLDGLDDAVGADLLVLVGGEGAAQPEGVERLAVAGRKDLRADDRGFAHGAGAGDQRQQPRMVGRIERDFSDALEGLDADRAGEGLVRVIGGADHLGVLELQLELGAQPVVIVVARHVGLELGPRPGDERLFEIGLGARRCGRTG